MPRPRIPLGERIDLHSIPEPNTGCWIWIGGTAGDYGKITIRDGADVQTRQAHVVAWELKHGPVPDGLELDHKCRNTLCVNPEHLEPVTHRENQRRGTSPVARNIAADACIRGHALDGENLYVTPDGRRQCRTCQRAREIAYKDGARCQ